MALTKQSPKSESRSCGLTDTNSTVGNQPKRSQTHRHQHQHQMESTTNDSDARRDPHNIEPDEPSDVPNRLKRLQLQQQQHRSQLTKRDGIDELAEETASAVLAQVSPNGRSSRLESGADSKLASEPGAPKSLDERSSEEAAGAGDPSLLARLTVDALLWILFAFIKLYDLLTQPIYYWAHQVYRKEQEVNLAGRSRQIDPTDCNSPWKQYHIDRCQRQHEARIDSFETYDEVMRQPMRDFSDSICYGYRQLLHEHWVKRSDSDKLLRKVRLSDYKWITFAQFETQIEAARRGFLLEGVRAGDMVMIYADTRVEWQICSQALMRLGAIVSTMYSTLGVDGIVHSFNETRVSHVVTQNDKVSKLLRLKTRLPTLKEIIYFDSTLKFPLRLGGTPGDSVDDDLAQFEPEYEHGQVQCISFAHLLCKGLHADDEQIEQLEELSREELDKRTKDSVAIIMYTSGSTGIPKGVLISHRNLLATLKAFTHVTRDFVKEARTTVSAAYLPLAHIFEFSIESMLLYHGVKFGFATPHTLTDKSPGLQAGQVGDLTLLKPTMMIIVPLILDRVVMGIKQALKAQSYFKEQLVTKLIAYKSRWQRRHYDTPIVDRLVCSKIAVALGGRVKFCICGSAPLSPETQIFVRAALNLKLPQGFGTTETCASTSCQLFEDQTVGNVGVPVPGGLVKLEPWLEGNYRPTDKPNPRGEIVVGGDMITPGYFNLDELTRESFYVDKDGVRWYRTGDIGEFLPNGNLKIIDRKKDLVKLQNGEFISLGRVESTLKSNPFMDNFCVFANSNYNYVVALGPANELAIVNLAQRLVDEAQGRNSPPGSAQSDEPRRPLLDEQEQEAMTELKEILAEYEADRINNNDDDGDRNVTERKMSSLSTNSTPAFNERLNRLCENALIKETVLRQMTELARERSLNTLEIPKKIMLLAEEWTEDKNLVTAALKIRRNFIYKRYSQQLASLYGSKT